jgi:F0F1-type ATP synthase epsilon subunit
MTELAHRVTELERRMDNVEPLARATDQEVAGWRGVLKNHTEVLNAIREDQVAIREDQVAIREDQVAIRKDQVRLERKVDDGFRQTNENFAHVEAKFGVLKAGLDEIKDLLTPDRSDEP